jgi:hypothetical protein
MVGVPDFIICVLGPSSLIHCPPFLLAMKEIIIGVTNAVMINDIANGCTIFI